MQATCIHMQHIDTAAYVLTFGNIVAAPTNFRYTSVTSNSITFQWNPLSEDVQVSWYVITCFEGSIILTVRITSVNINIISCQLLTKFCINIVTCTKNLPLHQAKT